MMKINKITMLLSMICAIAQASNMQEMHKNNNYAQSQNYIMDLLISGIYSSDPALVQQAIARGADINYQFSKESNYRTPLDYALELNDPVIIHLLLEDNEPILLEENEPKKKNKTVSFAKHKLNFVAPKNKSYEQSQQEVESYNDAMNEANRSRENLSTQEKIELLELELQDITENINVWKRNIHKNKALTKINQNESEHTTKTQQLAKLQEQLEAENQVIAGAK